MGVLVLSLSDYIATFALVVCLCFTGMASGVMLLMCAPKAYVLIFKAQSQASASAPGSAAKWDVETQFKDGDDLGMCIVQHLYLTHIQRSVHPFSPFTNAEFVVLYVDQLGARPVARRSGGVGVIPAPAPPEGSGGSNGSGGGHGPSSSVDVSKKDDLWE